MRDASDVAIERRAIWRSLTSREAVFLLSGVVLLCLQRWYRTFGVAQDFPTHGVVEWHLATTVCLFVIPVLLAIGYRIGPQDLGVGWGRPAVWTRYLAVYAVIIAPLVVAASRVPEFRDYYPLYRAVLERHELVPLSVATFGVYFFAWEFFFRGFLLLGLERRFGAYGIVVQTVPFVLMHLGKPQAEVLSAVVAGLALGLMAYRGRSVLPVWLLHWGVATALDLLVIYGPGPR